MNSANTVPHTSCVSAQVHGHKTASGCLCVACVLGLGWPPSYKNACSHSPDMVLCHYQRFIFGVGCRLLLLLFSGSPAEPISLAKWDSIQIRPGPLSSRLFLWHASWERPDAASPPSLPDVSQFENPDSSGGVAVVTTRVGICLSP